MPHHASSTYACRYIHTITVRHDRGHTICPPNSLVARSLRKTKTGRAGLEVTPSTRPQFTVHEGQEAHAVLPQQECTLTSCDLLHSESRNGRGLAAQAIPSFLVKHTAAFHLFTFPCPSAVSTWGRSSGHHQHQMPG